MKKISLLILIVTVLTACKKDKTSIYDEVYEVEFVGLWSAASHPQDYPSNAHFSPMVGFSHVAGLDAIGQGLSATEGVQSMAETGNTATLIKEIEDYRALNFALDKFTGVSIDGTGTDKAQIGVEGGKHTVSVFSMIAPSPDWFVAASTSLLDPNDGKWYDYVEVSAQVFDAGTDSAKAFTAADMPNDPKEPPQRLNTADIILGCVEQSKEKLRFEDFTPLPCGDPNCATIGYLLRTPIGTRSISDFIDFTKVQDFLRDKVNYELADLQTCGCENTELGELLHRFEMTEKDCFRLFIKPFMDAWTWDQDRIDRCCTHVIRPDGKLDSFCRYYSGFPDAWPNEESASTACSAS